MEKQDTPTGQRTLAAVMFTDVVEFSRRMGEDEDHTLSLVQRDLTLISALCDGFRGRVVKRTGDGVMALFTSGSDAVECAQEVQRQLAEYARALPEREVLSHRIGLHLGDVYVSADEVMGDGVNIAQRLQSEAPPGGICISQALYEVVRRRLAIRTVHLGARQLRNIDEAVHVYQVITPGAKASNAGPGLVRGASNTAQRVFLAFGVLGIVLVAGAAFLAVKGMRSGSSAGGIPLAEVAEPNSEEVQASADEVEPPKPAPSERPRRGPFADVPRRTPSAQSPARSGAVARPSQPSAPQGAPAVARPPAGGAATQSSEAEQFRELDYNRDGKLTRQEIPFELRNRIMWADKDGDGVVTLEELKQGRARRLNRQSP
jgi:class 3 adenylate cyclase